MANITDATKAYANTMKQLSGASDAQENAGGPSFGDVLKQSIGGAIDAMSGDDGVADGALYGAITANVLKFTLPIAFTYAVGWGVLKGLETAGNLIKEKVA